jgi:hypothetical protein
MSKTPYVGMTVVVHDRGRPQAGRDVHPAIITQVVNEGAGTIAVRVLPEQGVDYPIKAINYMHGDAYMEGLSWRWPEDPAKVQTGAGEARTPAPQDVAAPTPGDHEPRTVAGKEVAKPGDAPKAGESSDVTGEGSLAAQDGNADAAEGKDGDDPFANLTDTPQDGKKPEDGADSASVANAAGNVANTAAGADANTSDATKGSVTAASEGAQKAGDKAADKKDDGKKTK